MNKTNVIKAGGVSLAVVTGSMLAVTAANAHMGGLSEEAQEERTSELAERFDLNESEVQSYFDEKKQERQTEREERRAEFVAGLVESGTLTQEQADELTALKDALKSEIEDLKESGAEREEIKALLDENKVKIEAWADAEGINLDDIRPDKGERRGLRR